MLYVGVTHGFISANTASREARKVWAVAVNFFDKHLEK